MPTSAQYPERSISIRAVLAEHQREKDGKNTPVLVVGGNMRTPDGPRQRTPCYLSELNDSAQARWLKTIEVFNEQGAVADFFHAENSEAQMNTFARSEAVHCSHQKTVVSVAA